MADDNDIEQQIKRTVRTLRPLDPPLAGELLPRRLRKDPPEIIEHSPQPKPLAILEACQKAADIVRSVHASHEAEGEALAKHLEQIGETFLKMCQAAAKQVRDLRIMPKEMADDTARELLQIGEQEERRHDLVTKGLASARDALLGIQGGSPKTS
jgi:hypothetical protein